MTHNFRGIAVTVRYVPTNRRAPKMSMEEFPKWEGQWYNQLSSEPFTAFLRGAVGVVTSGGARDTDEIIKQKVPLYYRRPARGIRPGRSEVESVQRPITVGGVLVRPGDVVVADGDGVVVVSREHAADVAAAARKILDGDKAGRRKLYEKLGMPMDSTANNAVSIRRRPDCHTLPKMVALRCHEPTPLA